MKAMLQLSMRERGLHHSSQKGHLRERFNESFKVKSPQNLLQRAGSGKRASTFDTSRLSNTCRHEAIKNCVIVDARQQRGGPLAPSDTASPLASVGRGCSCPTAQTLVMKLKNEMECMRIESEIVDEGVDDEAIEVQHLHVVAVGSGPAKQDIEHRVLPGHAQHRTWCDA